MFNNMYTYLNIYVKIISCKLTKKVNRLFILHSQFTQPDVRHIINVCNVREHRAVRISTRRTDRNKDNPPTTSKRRWQKALRTPHTTNRTKTPFSIF